MPDKAKPDDEPQDVKIVNPEPIPVKVEVTIPSPPAHTADVDATELAVKVAEVRSDKVAELAETALQLRLAAKDLADRLERADERKANADENRAARQFWQAIILGLMVFIPAALAAWNSRATHDAVNSRMTEMKELIEKSSFAEGVIEGSKTKTGDDDRKDSK